MTNMTNADYLKLLEAQAVAPHVLAQVREAFRFEERNLTSVERQKRHVSVIHLASPLCPWCDSACSYFEARPAGRR